MELRRQVPLGGPKLVEQRGQCPEGAADKHDRAGHVRVPIDQPTRSVRVSRLNDDGVACGTRFRLVLDAINVVGQIAYEATGGARSGSGVGGEVRGGGGDDRRRDAFWGRPPTAFVVVRQTRRRRFDVIPGHHRDVRWIWRALQDVRRIRHGPPRQPPSSSATTADDCAHRRRRAAIAVADVLVAPRRTKRGDDRGEEAGDRCDQQRATPSSSPIAIPVVLVLAVVAVVAVVSVVVIIVVIVVVVVDGDGDGDDGRGRSTSALIPRSPRRPLRNDRWG